MDATFHQPSLTRTLLLVSVLLGSWGVRVGCQITCRDDRYSPSLDAGVLKLINHMIGMTPHSTRSDYCNWYPKDDPYIWGHAKCYRGISHGDCFSCLTETAGYLRDECTLTAGTADLLNCMVSFEFKRITPCMSAYGP